MAVLSFKVQADYEKVAKLREEIVRLEGELRNVGRNTPTSEIQALETKLAEAKSQFTALATEAAKSGAAMDAAFKDKIRAATQSVSAFTREIAEQKARIKDIELHIQQYGDAYRKALASGSPKASSIKAELDAAKKALQEEKAALFGLTQQQADAKMTVKNLKDSYSEYKDEVKDVSKEVKDASKSQEGFNISLGKVAALVGGATALKQLVAQVVRVRGEFQDMETAIETLVGKDVTSKIMPQIKEMAKVSPLTMTDIVGAEKMMLSFNIDAEKSIQYLRALSDVSMGSSQKFNSLTLAFSQMSSAGKLMGQDLLQMINAGFNPLQTISEKTGKSISQLKEEMSKGAISAEMVQQAFLDATSAGGKFYNMSENASKIINGQISMMEDAMDAVFNEIGTKTEGLIIKSIQTVTSLIQNYEKIGKVLVGLVATYGAYRTAVLLSTAATSKHTLAEIALINVRIAARKAQMALNAAMLTNPYVAATVAIAGMASAMWMLNDNTAMAERRQRSYDEAKEAAAQKEKEHADAIQKLIDKVRDNTQADGERIVALEALRKEYPNIFAQYDIESLKLADILALKKQINEEDEIRQNYDLKSDIAEIDKKVAELRETKKYAGQSAAAIQSQIDDLLFERDKKAEELEQKNIAGFTGALSSKSLEELKAYLKQIESGAFKLDGKALTSGTRDSLKKAVQEAIDAINEANKKTYSEDYNAAKRKYEEDYAAFKWAEENKTKVTTKEYQNRKAAMEASEKEFKKLGGDPNEVKKENEKAGQQERLDSMTEKNARENARAAKDMEFKVWQSRIDAMKDGYAKTMAQKALDHQKELDSLERQKQDYIEKIVAQEKAIFDAQEDQKAKNDKKYKKQTFDADASRIRITSTNEVVKQYAKLGEDAAAAYSKAVDEAVKEHEFEVRQMEIDSMSDGGAKQKAQRALDNEKELYNLEQQREAYIEAAKAAHILAEKKKMAADPTYMMKMFDESQANADYDVILDNTRRQQYDILADEYLSYIDAKKSIDESYEADKAELEAAYNKTGDEKYKRSLDERYKAYIQALNALEGEHNTADYKLIFGDPSKMTSATIEKALGVARKRLSQLDKEADPETYQALVEAIDKLEDARDTNPFEGWGTSLMDILQIAHQIRNIKKDIEQYEQNGNTEAKEASEAQLEKSKKTLAKAIAGTGVATFGDILSKAASSMREVAEASGDIDLMEQAEALEKAGGFISSVASGAASGGWVGAIIGGASSLMDMLISSITESKVVAAEAKKAYEDYLDELAHSARTIDENDYETIFGVRVLDKVIDATREATVAWDDYQNALRSTGTTYSVNGLRKKVTRWQDSLANMLVLEGVNPNTVRKLENIPTLSEKFEGLFDKDGNLNMEKAVAILDTYSQYSNEEWYEALSDAVSALEDYEKNLKFVDNYLSSLFQNLGNDIADSILQGNDALETLQKSAGDIFKQIARQMVTEMLVSEDFIAEYKEKMRAAIGTEDYTDDADVVAEMTDELSANIEAAQKMWENIQRVAEERDIDMSGDESLSQQEASSKGYQTLSEDTGNELVGRAVAQYESNLRMEEATRSMKESVDLMAARQVMIHDIAAESRALIADSYLELQQIRENTGAVIKPIQNLSAKIDKWDSKIMSL